MKKKQLLLFLSLFLLTGCWDQSLLNQTKLIKAGGFDYSKDGKIIATAAIPQAVQTQEGMGREVNMVFHAKGNTVRQSKLLLDRKISERLDTSKNLIVVFGEETAKKDIYPFLDVFYRDPEAALNAKMAVTKGEAADIISTKFEEPKTSTGIGEYLRDLIRSAEESSTVPKESIQTICPVMFDPGQDFALPYLVPQKKSVEVAGVAIFHDETLAGKLTGSDAMIYNLLTGKKPNKGMATTKKIFKTKTPINDYVSIKIKKNKRSFSVNVSPSGEISADISIKTGVIVTEYPNDNLSTPTEIKSIEKKLSKAMTKDAQKVIDQLQEMNSDTFGVGRKVIAFHYPTWKKVKWEEDFKKVKYTASVDVKVIDHGIIE
jgi:Ger(x)C family germination protein